MDDIPPSHSQKIIEGQQPINTEQGSASDGEDFNFLANLDSKLGDSTIVHREFESINNAGDFPIPKVSNRTMIEDNIGPRKS